MERLSERPLERDAVAFKVGSGTLLSRDEEGRFSFIHQSVVEWLVANAAADDLREGRSPALLASAEMSDLMADFLWSLAGKEHTLACAVLEGANLSEASLVRADLSGAVLVRAQLRRANLEKANLAGADLQRCDLSFARLLGADLTGAKLAGARLQARGPLRPGLERRILVRWPPPGLGLR